LGWLDLGIVAAGAALTMLLVVLLGYWIVSEWRTDRE
jgi:hypothetical protein